MGFPMHVLHLQLIQTHLFPLFPLFEDPPTLSAVPVFLVDADEVQIDPEVYDTSGLEFTDYEEQGNGQGSC
jgi:hypothetical protein